MTFHFVRIPEVGSFSVNGFPLFSRGKNDSCIRIYLICATDTSLLFGIGKREKPKKYI